MIVLYDGLSLGGTSLMKSGMFIRQDFSSHFETGIISCFSLTLFSVVSMSVKQILCVRTRAIAVHHILQYFRESLGYHLLGILTSQ